MASNFGPPEYMYKLSIPALQSLMAEKRALSDKYASKRGSVGNHAYQQYMDAKSMLNRRLREAS